MKQKDENIIAVDLGTSTVKGLMASLNVTTNENNLFYELQGIIEPLDGISKKKIINKEKFNKSFDSFIKKLENYSGYTISEIDVVYTTPSIIFRKEIAGLTKIRNIEGIHVTKEWLGQQEEKIKLKIRGINKHNTCVYLKITSILADGEEIIHDPYDYIATDSIFIEYRYILTSSIYIDTIKENIERFVGIASIKPCAVTNIQYLTENEKENGVIVCDIGSDFTNITVVKDGNIIGIKTVLFGGNIITNEIALLKKISLKEAEKNKNIIETKNSILTKTDLIKLNKKLEIYIKNEILSYVKNIDNKLNFPAGIMIMGGGSNFYGIDKIFEKVFSIYSFILDEDPHVQSNTKYAKYKWHPVFALAKSIGTEKITNNSFNLNSKSMLTTIGKILHNTSKIFT